MKISLEWLGEMIAWSEKNPHEIARRLTLSSAEVEEVQELGALLEHCCVGRVKALAKHPGADKLSVLEVETDKGMKKVVCGGTNLKDGMLVAFAHVGATVRHGDELVTLQKAKIRGEESEGMICAAEELGLEERFPPSPDDGAKPIVDLTNAGLKPLAPLREALGMNDTVLHVNNTAITQRPDLFSHVGFARECVAIGIATWKKGSQPAFATPVFPKTAMPFAIRSDTDAVPRYCACILEIGDIGETPEWMRKRLEATGWRSVSLPVDITNYVSMETGMPLHSFDADDLKGDVSMRLSKKGETIVTLDDVERKLPDGAVVLSDDEGIFDLLGIMGGLRSSTKNTTRRILLHSAIVDPVRIRKAIIATGHRTDASTVYEKGIPRITAERGFFRALELMLELIPGAKIVSRMDTWGDDGKPVTLDLDAARVRSMLGDEIPVKEMAGVLEAIGCEVKIKGEALHVTLPLHRTRDLTGTHDLIEEIGRIRGYDRIASAMPSAELRVPERDWEVHAMRDALKGDGFFEIMPLSLTGPKQLAACKLDPARCVALANPIGETTSLLEPSLLPGLLEHAQASVHLVDGHLKTFRWGHVFEKGKEENVDMGLLLWDASASGLLDEPLLQLRAALEAAVGEAARTIQIEPHPEPPAFAHPGRCARLKTSDGKDAGVLCELHPSVAAQFDLSGRTAVALMSLSCLLKSPATSTLAKPLPHFPDVTYDETMPRAHANAIGPALAKLTASNPLLESASIHDLYAGKGVPEGSYNVTVRFVYRAADKTLTDDEAKKAHEKVLSSLSHVDRH